LVARAVNRQVATTLADPKPLACDEIFLFTKHHNVVILPSAGGSTDRATGFRRHLRGSQQDLNQWGGDDAMFARMVQ
jgi:hypothetical protein